MAAEEEEDDGTEKGQARMPACLGVFFVHTQAHERARGWVSEGERERVGGPVEAVGFFFSV